MSSKNLIKFLLLIFSMLPLLSKGQGNPYGEVSIASPTAASLGKYADIPVSYHTGIPQIDIPIYTVQSGSLSLPIGLSYHASGLKVLETASWVGAGWSLSAGGVITRTVMGLPDEKGTGSGGVNVYGYFTDSGYNNYLNRDFPFEDWGGFAQGRKDGEPDLFFFNFGGYSGKFFFRDDHTPILVPQQDLTIVPYFPYPGTTSIQGFIVTTPDGTRYYFGNTPNVTGTAPIEITNPYSDENGYSSGTVISSWYLNKIASADSLFSISLNYTSENYGYYTFSSVVLDPMAGYGLSPAFELHLVKNIVSGVRLSKINFPNGTIDFIPGSLRTDLSDNGLNAWDYTNTSATTLGSINISNTSTSAPFCKKFNFYYGYFTDNITPQPAGLFNSGLPLQTDKLRLRLDSLREMSCDNLLQIPARKFTYFSEKVPRRICLGQDHWGFYNGADTNKTLIPTYNTYDGTVLTPVYGGNREAAWPAMRGGALHQMSYPTGGTTIFDFEPADSYLKSGPIATLLQMTPVVFINTYGANNLPQSYPFFSNGNPISFTTFNKTADFQAKFYITDLSNNVVYGNQFFGDNNYPAGQSSTLPPVTLPRGNYMAYISFPASTPPSPGNPGNPPPGDEADVRMYQIDTLINNHNVTIGGLRIMTITHSDSANNSVPIITNYSYPSGGFLYSFPTYIQHLRNDLIKQLGFWSITNGFQRGLGSNNGCPLSGSYFLRSGGSLRPMATTQGYHIGFPRVIVTQTGSGSSEYNYYTSNTGYGAQSIDPTVQTIDIRLQACESTTPNYPAAPLSFDYKKGELYFERHFNQAGDLLKDAYYYPEFDTASLQPTPGFIVASRTSPTGDQQMYGTYYNLFSPRRTKLHTIETTYAPGIGGVQQDSYSYYGSSFHNQVTRKVTTTSTGDSLITITKYTPDFHLSSWDISPSCETTYNNACTTCLTNKRYADSICSNCSGDSITAHFLTYRRCVSDARIAYVISRLNNYIKPGNYYQTQHNTSKGAAGPELKPIYELQDSGRVVPIEITDYRNGYLLKANFTRYDYTPGLSGVPFPNKTQLVNLQSPSSTFTNAVISGATLTKDSRYLDETTYSFLRGNPARVTGHDGLNTIYIWDYLNTKPIAKTISATTDTTAFSSFEAEGTGNWTLTNAGGNTSQVTVNVNAAGANFNLFPTQVTTNLTSNDHNTPAGMELGIKFTSSTAGTINGVRFYKTSGNTGTHIGELYSSTGVRLAQATFTGETASGWQTVLFSSPVSITANTTYTAAYFSPLGNYVEDVFYFLNNPVSNGPLNAIADGTSGMVGTDPGNGQGVYLSTASAAFPNKLYQAANYWVDVVFAPNNTPYANAGTNQTITLPVSSVVLNGSGSTGTISSFSWTKVSGPNSPTIASPTSAFTSISGLIQGVYVFQLSLNSGASVAQVTVTVQPSGTPMNIFTTQVVPTVTLNDGSALEVGAKFRSSVAGQITGIRFYKTSGNTGTHIGELYAYPSGTRLAQATFSGETASGWQTVTFSSPVSISANTTYIAAYWSGSGNYSANSNHYSLPITNGPLTGLADGTDGHNGIYSYTSSPAFPTTYTVMADDPNYWVDVLFLPDNTPIPNAGNNLSMTLPVSSVTLNGNNSGGTISNYLWTKVSGPNNPTIVSPNSLITNVTGLIAGTYVFQLAVNGASNSVYALTGTKSYNLIGNTITKTGLTNGKKYILSYWSRGSACSVSGASNSTSTGRSANGWTYYQHTVTMTSTTLTVTGSSYIDELRLYPQGAQMSSYTYKPEVGITSMNDPNGEITFYEYDGLARLKNVKDYQGNIIKNFQYNYVDPNSCGPNCSIVALQTFAGTNTLSYPVGVFSLKGKLLGNASNQSQYISVWLSDTANSNTGTITQGPDSLHFRFAANSGKSIPAGLTGMRYYQYDIAFNQIDGILKRNGEYVDFGDGTGMFLGKTITDTANIILAPNTIATAGTDWLNSYFIHTYADTSLKTITLYHNDGNETMALDNNNWPATSLTYVKNLRGYCPQFSTLLTASSYQYSSALTVASIVNWNSINSISAFALNSGDGGTTPCKNVGYTQNFMQNNVGLNLIKTALHPYYISYYDSTFKLSKLKSNWNTYFTNLQQIWICDDHWNHEDLTALTNLSLIYLVNGNQNRSNNLTNNPPIPIAPSVLDNILIQIANGSGQRILNGTISIETGGSSRTSASDAALNFLKSKGWGIYFNNVQY